MQGTEAPAASRTPRLPYFPPGPLRNLPGPGGQDPGTLSSLQETTLLPSDTSARRGGGQPTAQGAWLGALLSALRTPQPGVGSAGTGRQSGRTPRPTDAGTGLCPEKVRHGG